MRSIPVVAAIVLCLCPPLARAEDALSPGKLSTLQGIELGQPRATALARFEKAQLPIKEPNPGMALIRMVFNRKPADFVFVFTDGKLSGISAALVDPPASSEQRLASFKEDAAFLTARYGKPTIVDEAHLAVGWKAGDRYVVYRWNDPGKTFQLVFGQGPTSSSRTP
jgi:hypothetical protein